jgi:ABC-type branched-subunit amino acid transport system substrate-binding protein
VRRKGRWIAAAAVAAVVGAFASTGVATGTVAARVANVRGVTDTTINVAGLAQQSQFSAQEMKVGVTAAFNTVNNSGGVFGRKINYVESADDKGDPTTNLSEAQRLVQQDQVFAIVPALTPVIDQATQFFAQQHVPFFGWGIDHGFCNNPYAFGFTGCIVPPPTIPTTGTTWGALIATYFKNHGSPGGSAGKTAAVISEDNDTGRSGAIVIGAQAKKTGFKVVFQKNDLPATPPGDYSPYVHELMTSNGGKQPDVIFVTTSVQNTLNLPGKLVQAGFKGILTNPVLYDPRAVSLMKGNSVFTQFDIPEDTSNAAMQKIVSNLKGAGAQTITQPMLSAYFSADAFVSVLKKVGKNLTPETLAKTIANFTYQVPGVIGPTKYPAAKTLGSPCGTLAYSDGTAWTVQVPFACYQDFNYKTGKFLKF